MRSSLSIFHFSYESTVCHCICSVFGWCVGCWRFLNPCGLLLDLRGNYTDLIKKEKQNVADEVYKSNVSHVTMLWP